MQFIFILFVFIFTIIGGFLAFKFRNKMNLILGLTAGIILGVVSFDIFPEIIDMTNKLGVDPLHPMIALVVGFILFHIAEKFLLAHHSHEDAYGPHTHPTIGKFQALALAGHLFLDGAGIGLAFQISTTTGIFMAIAVLAHSFSDGLNVVSLMIHNKNTDRKAWQFLFFDAMAPVLGCVSTLFFTLSERTLLLYLGFFAGFLLYIGVSDILPEAHSKNSSMKTVLMTVLGVLFIFLVTVILE